MDVNSTKPERGHRRSLIAINSVLPLNYSIRIEKDRAARYARGQTTNTIPSQDSLIVPTAVKGSVPWLRPPLTAFGLFRSSREGILDRRTI